jgi:hypothetical protein
MAQSPVEKRIIVVETVGLEIPWTEPRDLDIAETAFRINSRNTPGISSKHAGGAHVLDVEGCVYFLPESMDPTGLRKMILDKPVLRKGDSSGSKGAGCASPVNVDNRTGAAKRDKTVKRSNVGGQ